MTFEAKKSLKRCSGFGSLQLAGRFAILRLFSTSDFFFWRLLLESLCECTVKVALVRFGYGSYMGRFERFRFSVPMVPLWKGFCLFQYHPFQNHCTHKITIFKLFRSLQLQFSGPTGINFRYSYSFVGLTGICLYSYSSVQLHKEMVFGIIFRKLQLQLHKEMVLNQKCNAFEKNGTLIFLSLLFRISFFLFSSLFWALSLLSQGFEGFSRKKNPCFFAWASLLFPKNQGKEDQGTVCQRGMVPVPVTEKRLQRFQFLFRFLEKKTKNGSDGSGFWFSSVPGPSCKNDKFTGCIYISEVWERADEPESLSGPFGPKVTKKSEKSLSGPSGRGRRKEPKKVKNESNGVVLTHFFMPIVPQSEIQVKFLEKYFQGDWWETRRNFGEIFRWFSSFNFQGNWPQKNSHKFLHTSGPQIPHGWPKILSRRYSGSWWAQHFWLIFDSFSEFLAPRGPERGWDSFLTFSWLWARRAPKGSVLSFNLWSLF